MNPITQTPDATTYLAAADALHRFAGGQDFRDEDLFRSAWADEAELDFQQPAERLGVALPPFRGRDTIVAGIMGSTAGLHTTHTVSNVRVHETADGCEVTALVEAQHLPRNDPARHLLLKNIYRCRLVRQEGQWRIRHMRIDNVWMEGDAAVLFPR